MKNYTKARKNLQYIKVFQRIEFIGESWYQQTQTVHNTEVPILTGCPHIKRASVKPGLIVSRSLSFVNYTYGFTDF